MNLVPLATVAHVQLGKMLSPKSKTGVGSFPYLRNQNVQWNRFELADMAAMDFSEREREKFRLLPGDLLVCEGGEPGRCAVWPGTVENCYYQKAIHRVRPRDGLANSEFLSMWIRFQAMRGAFQEQNAKTTIAHLPLVRLLQLSVPDLGLKAQETIAARLKAQLEEVEIALQAATTRLLDVTRLRSHIVNDVFAQIQGRPTSLAEVLVDIQAGKSFQTSEVLAGPDELGVLKVSAITWSAFREEEAKVLSAAYQPSDNHRVRAGDFIISRANTKEFVGAVVLVDKDYPNRLLSDKTLRLVLKDEIVSKEFLLFALRSSMAREHIEAFATGSSDSMRNISQPTIRTIPLKLPVLAEQRRIAPLLVEKLAEVDKASDASKLALQNIKQLPRQILSLEFQDKATL